MPWGDQSILDEILRQTARRYDDPRMRRIARRAAVQTGIVESGGRNLSGGDADSQGWRQERASLYDDPRNVSASVGRFLNEFDQFYDPGEKSWQVAAQVQRPAAQYRGRYRDVRGEARRLLRGAGGAGAPGGAAAAGGAVVRLPGRSPRRDLGQSNVDVASLLGAIQEPKPQLQSAGLPAPAFSAQAPMPFGAQIPMSAGGPQAKPDVGSLLNAVRTTGADAPNSDLPGGGLAITPGGKQGSFVPTPVHPSGQGASRALSWAESKVGFTEATGNNDGGLAGRLNRRFGFSNAPWCAMFTSAAVTRGGAPKSARTASVAEVRAKAQAKQGYTGFVNPARAKAGDLILWGNDHIGMVRSVSNGKINFVAGNHSNGVRYGSVPIGNGDIVRPAYKRRGR